jgi:hypothetical protein
MSVTRRLTRIIGALSIGLALTACGNANQDASNLLKQLPKAPANIGKKQQPMGIAPEQIGQALASTQAPIALFTAEDRQLQFLMLEIERNAPHRTFGSSSRQTVSFRGGMMSSTRGLGGDLMSSDSAALYALVSSRQSGQARYVIRFLTPEDKTIERSFDCSVSAAAKVPVQAGEINIQAQGMVTVCNGGGFSFSNVFAVNSAGQIVTARQWMGDALGYFTMQMLRY